MELLVPDLFSIALPEEKSLELHPHVSVCPMLRHDIRWIDLAGNV